METPQTERKSIFPILVGFVVAMGLGAGLALEHQHKVELREEQQALQEQLDRVTGLAAENERQAPVVAAANPARPLANDSAGELARLRAELSALRQLTNELDSARKENTEAHAALDHYLTNAAAPQIATADFWPQDSWSFTGYATPDDAMRSFLWAAYTGNMKALTDSTTGRAREEMAKEYEGKSPDEASIRAMDDAGKLRSVQVLNRDYQSGDTAVLTATFDERDQPRAMKVTLKKVGNEWKLESIDD
jgi:hypothetical protein